MRRRRTLALTLVLVLMLMLPCGMPNMDSSVNAANKSGSRYYYNQLKADAKGIYDAMYEMYVQGIFKTGTQEYDLVENGHITSEQLAAYKGKQDDLLNVFGAARDAFYADYPNIFYVDFSSLSILVSEHQVPAEESESETVAYGASLGIGRRDTYYVEGFADVEQVEKAIREQEARIDEIVKGAKKHSQSAKEQVIYINNAIIDNTEYRLDTNCDPGNSGHVRTAYGALVKGQSLCEGYARATKTVLDAMGINSVLVQGDYCAPDGSRELHMWNNVQIDGEWYGLDATANDGMKGNSEKYLLADKTTMDKTHIPNGVMSEAGFRFTYPQLTEGDDGQGDGEESSDEGSTDNKEYTTIFDKDDFLVQYREEAENGVFKVSYKGMGYQDAVDKEGVYILTRFYQFVPGTGEYKVGDWGYSDPKPFAMPQLKDALVVANANSRYMEFAITKKKPAGPLYGEDLSMDDLKNNWTFQGTESDFLVSTGKLDNPKGTYVPSPFAKKLTPSNTGYLSSGKKYHVTVEINEPLVKCDGQEIGCEVAVEDGWSAGKNSKIENLKWDNDRTVEFDFTPSDQLADNYARYIIQITGLQGKGSLKAPDSFTYDSKNKISVCAYRSQGIYWNLGAKPQLLEPSDISCNNWKLEDGRKLEDAVSKLVLVAAKPEVVSETPDKSQTDQMMDMVSKELGQAYTVEKSATYNIKLMTCNQNIVQTGQSVRLHIGFPENYGPDNEGVTYKAYHFIKDKSGNIVNVEELACIVTDKGLIVTCNSFSPFAVVALKEKVGTVNAGLSTTSQKLLVMNSAGGTVDIEDAGNDRICELKQKGDSKTIVIKAKDGYSISGIYLSDSKERPVIDKKSMKLTVKYEELAGEGNILEVVFAADKPKQDATSSTQDKPSSDTKTNVTQQSESGSNQSDNTAIKSDSSPTVHNTGNDTKADTPVDSAAANLPTVVLPQQQEIVSVIEQPPAVPSTTPGVTPSTSTTTNIVGKINADTASGGDVISSDQASGIPEGITSNEESGEETIVLSTGENGVELVVRPTGENGADEGEKDRVRRLLVTILISAAGIGIVVTAITIFVKRRRSWSE